MTTAEKSESVHEAWADKTQPRRGPKPTLTRAEIARAAIRIGDAEGLKAVTMQRVAGEVGLTTMALYRYFPGKAELVGLMIDSASDTAPEFGEKTDSWEARLKKWANLCLAIYRSHPWFLEATSARHSLMGPNELTWLEAALEMLAESGLALWERHDAFLAIIGHVRGYATFQQAQLNNQTRLQWVDDLTAMLRTKAHRYPALLDALAAGVFSQDSETAFDFGLDCILRGIRTHIRRQGEYRGGADREPVRKEPAARRTQPQRTKKSRKDR